MRKICVLTAALMSFLGTVGFSTEGMLKKEIAEKGIFKKEVTSLKRDGKYNEQNQVFHEYDRYNKGDFATYDDYFDYYTRFEGEVPHDGVPLPGCENYIDAQGVLHVRNFKQSYRKQAARLRKQGAARSRRYVVTGLKFEHQYFMDGKIPEREGCLVTLFQENYGIRRIEISEGFNEIGDSAFSFFCGLKEVILPEGMVKIGACVFAECCKLSQASLPSTVSSIGRYAFARTGLKKISLTQSLTYIDDCAFTGSKLTEISLSLRVAPPRGKTKRVCLPMGATPLDYNSVITAFKEVRRLKLKDK